MSYLRGTGVVEDADVVEVAVSLGVVESVTHHELVGDFEADVAHVHWPQAALGLIHQGRDADGMRLALIQHVHQIVQGYPAIHDVFDNQHVGALKRNVEVLGDLDFAGTGFAFTVGGDAHEINLDIASHGAGQVRHEENRAFENANHVQIPGGVIRRDLYA